MRDSIAVSLYPVLLLRGEPARLAYLPLLIYLYGGTGYGIFLFCCCFAEYSETFLRKSKRFFSEENEIVQELWLCAYDAAFCALFLSSCGIGCSPSPTCDASRYLRSTASDLSFLLCLARCWYELCYVVRPGWFAKRQTDRNVPSLLLTFACVIFSAAFGAWRNCLEVFAARHLLEAVERISRVCALVGRETAGVRLEKLRSAASVPLIVAVAAKALVKGGGDPFCEFVVLATHAAGATALLIERVSVY